MFQKPFTIFFIPAVPAVPPPATAVLLVDYAILNSSVAVQNINTVGEQTVVWNDVPVLDQINTLVIAPTGEIDLGLPGFYEVVVQGTIEFNTGSLNFDVMLKHGANIVSIDRANQSDDNTTLNSIEEPLIDPVDLLEYNGPTYAHVSLTGIIDATVTQEISVTTLKTLGGGAASNAFIGNGQFQLIIKRIPT